MISFLKKLIGREQDYDSQKKSLEKGNLKNRTRLAAGKDTHPEILYYLAKDSDAGVRRAVAVNRATPVQASTLLATDKSADVRLALAARLVELLPALPEDKHSHLYAYVVQAMGTLAQDEVLKIRKALSSALKDHAKAPPKVATQLARDVEREVSEPILRYCAALPDDDLLDILSTHPEPWVISAIASRQEVSETVTDAVVKTEDIPANTILVNNSGARYSTAALKTIIDRAKLYPEWHGPLAMRKELSLDLAQQLAGFVDEAVLKTLSARKDFDEKTSRAVAEMVKRRIAYGSSQSKAETAEQKLARYIDSGTLTADVIYDALVWQDDAFVHLALSYLSGIHPVIAEKMLKSGAARPLIALCWQAKMPMRLAVDLQLRYAKLQPRDVIYARGGTAYPLSEEEIQWQLEFFGVVISSP